MTMLLQNVKQKSNMNEIMDIYLNVQIFKCPDIQIFKYLDMQIFGCPDIKIPMYLQIQILKCPDI